MGSSKRGAKHGNSAKKIISREYIAGLKDYWSGRPRTAIEHVSKLLADNPDADQHFALYRLWIEVLANEGEFAALRSLEAHLQSRAESELDRHNTYMALRGLIHFELDEQEAVNLILRGLARGATADHYYMELCQLVQQRHGMHHPSELLAAARGKLVDYFHWQTLARSLHLHQDRKNLRTVLGQVHAMFPESPLNGLFALHDSFEQEDFSAAEQHAHGLIDKFPGVTDYDVYGAFATMQCADFTAAAQHLNKTASVVGESDADVMALLGHCYEQMFIDGDDTKLRDRAATCLTKAAALLEENGMSAIIPLSHRNSLIPNEAQTDNNKSRVWLVKLSARRFNELQTAAESEVQYLCRSLGQGPQPDDLCFIVGDGFYGAEDEYGKSWRMGAVYSVLSGAEWHPTMGHVHLLRLVSRPAVSVPIDIQMLDQPSIKGRKTNRNHPVHHGVFELDHSALEIIATAVHQRLDNDRSIAGLNEELARVRRIS